jgi:hypothetical protein
VSLKGITGDDDDDDNEGLSFKFAGLTADLAQSQNQVHFVD